MYENVTVAFQGTSGSFSEIALVKFFGARPERLPLKDFEQVFKAVQHEKCLYGIVPIENSIIGSITGCLDKFIEYPAIAIVGEITIKIEHALIGLPEASIEDITTVYSQLPGLEQCSKFLSKKEWHVVPFTDTGAAVAHVSKTNKKQYAAIASTNAAEFYKLIVLSPNIENNNKNFTRFAIIRKTKDSFYNDNSIQYKNINFGIVIFSAPHRPGGLLECLQIFRKNKINLNKIESRPIIGKPWEYQFLVELNVSSQDTDIKKTLHELCNQTNTAHIIGFYNRDTTNLT